MDRSKYANLLPDIDLDGKDVFETEDSAAEATALDDGDSDTEYTAQARLDSGQDIATDRLDAQKSRAKFKGSRLADPDFSDKLIRRKPVQKYPLLLPESSTYEYIPRGYSSRIPTSSEGNAEETPAAKLRRLRLEVDELELELERDPMTTAENETPEASSGVLLAQLQSLRGDLKRMASEPNKTTTSDSALREGPKAVKSESTQNSTSQTLINLSAQVDVLESIIGPASASQILSTSSGSNVPLSSTIHKVEAQLSLLTQPRHLDTLNRRIKVLLTDLDRIHETRRRLGDTTPLNVALPTGLVLNVPGTGMSSATEVASYTGTSKVPSTPKAAGHSGSQADSEESAEGIPRHLLPRLSALVELLPQMNALMPIVPSLLLRLRTLNDLHTSASDFDSNLGQAKAQLQSMSESTAALQSVLNKVEESLQQNQAVMQNNLAQFEGRLAKVIAER